VSSPFPTFYYWCLTACLPACPPVRHLGPEAIKPHQRVNSLFALICTHFCFTWIYVTWRGCLQFTRKPLSSLTSRRYHSQMQFFVHCRLQKSCQEKKKIAAERIYIYLPITILNLQRTVRQGPLFVILCRLQSSARILYRGANNNKY
jgi:hypothetical protein